MKPTAESKIRRLRFSFWGKPHVPQRKVFCKYGLFPKCRRRGWTEGSPPRDLEPEPQERGDLGPSLIHRRSARYPSRGCRVRAMGSGWTFRLASGVRGS